jgi:hypothetical protein
MIWLQAKQNQPLQRPLSLTVKQRYGLSGV